MQVRVTSFCRLGSNNVLQVRESLGLSKSGSSLKKFSNHTALLNKTLTRPGPDRPWGPRREGGKRTWTKPRGSSATLGLFVYNGSFSNGAGFPDSVSLAKVAARV